MLTNDEAETSERRKDNEEENEAELAAQYYAALDASQGDQPVSRPLLSASTTKRYPMSTSMSVMRCPMRTTRRKWWIFRREMGKSLALIPAEHPWMIAIKRRIGTQTSYIPCKK
jgi:hypothetical protein